MDENIINLINSRLVQVIGYSRMDILPHNMVSQSVLAKLIKKSRQSFTKSLFL